MILTEEQRKDFEAAARPLIEWLCKNCNPHVTAIVKPGEVELFESVAGIPVTDYIPD